MGEQSLALRGGSSIAPPWREREHVIGITSASQRGSVAANIVTRIVCARAKVHVLGRLVSGAACSGGGGNTTSVTLYMPKLLREVLSHVMFGKDGSARVTCSSACDGRRGHCSRRDQPAHKSFNRTTYYCPPEKLNCTSKALSHCARAAAGLGEHFTCLREWPTLLVQLM
jgi:hypothetical protein